MNQKLVKSIRRSAKAIWIDSPMVDYTKKGKTTVLTDRCIKRIVKDTKRLITHGRKELREL